MGGGVVANAAVARARQTGLVYFATWFRARMVVATAVLYVPKVLIYA